MGKKRKGEGSPKREGSLYKTTLLCPKAEFPPASLDLRFFLWPIFISDSLYCQFCEASFLLTDLEVSSTLLSNFSIEMRSVSLYRANFLKILKKTLLCFVLFLTVIINHIDNHKIRSSGNLYMFDSMADDNLNNCSNIFV